MAGDDGHHSIGDRQPLSPARINSSYSISGRTLLSLFLHAAKNRDSLLPHCNAYLSFTALSLIFKLSVAC